MFLRAQPWHGSLYVALITACVWLWTLNTSAPGGVQSSSDSLAYSSADASLFSLIQGYDTYSGKLFESASLSKCRYAVGRWVKQLNQSTLRFYASCGFEGRVQCTQRSAFQSGRCTKNYEQFSKARNNCQAMVNDYEKQASYIWLPKSVEELPAGPCATNYWFDAKRFASLLSPGSSLGLVGDSQVEVMYSSLGCMLSTQVTNYTITHEKRWWEPRKLTLRGGGVVELALSKIGVDIHDAHVVTKTQNITNRDFHLFNLRWTDKIADKKYLVFMLGNHYALHFSDPVSYYARAIRNIAAYLESPEGFRNDRVVYFMTVPPGHEEVSVQICTCKQT
jgi:hypothetical protein